MTNELHDPDFGYPDFIPTEPGELDDEKRAVQSVGGLAIALAIVATICALIALPHLLKWLAS